MIHRDIASRNFLVTTDCRIVVSDFGLCRGLQRKLQLSDNKGKPYSYVYQMTQGGDLPTRCTSPESLAGVEWTTSSDVWSFGKKPQKKKRNQWCFLWGRRGEDE